MQIKQGRNLVMLPNGDVVHPLYAVNELSAFDEESELSGLWDAATSGASSLYNTAARSSATVVGYVSATAGRVRSTVGQAGRAYVAHTRRIYNTAGKAIGYAASVPGKVANKVVNKVEQVARVGGKVVNGVITAEGRIIRGIGRTASSAAGGVSTAAETAIGYLPSPGAIGATIGTAFGVGTWVLLGVGAIVLLVVLKVM
jgi:hypothetical protein